MFTKKVKESDWLARMRVLFNLCILLHTLHTNYRARYEVPMNTVYIVYTVHIAELYIRCTLKYLGTELRKIIFINDKYSNRTNTDEQESDL